MFKTVLFATIITIFISCGGSSSSGLQPNGADGISFTQTQRTIADQFISIFENGTPKIMYDYAENIQDGRGITAGQAGFTSATGDMLMVIKRYTEKKPNNSLAKYIDELERLFKLYKDNGYKLTSESANTSNLEGLKEAWDENTKYELFIDTQIELVDELYYYPAMQKANELGLKYPLSLLVIYDSYIQHGKNGVDDLIVGADRLSGGSVKNGVDELTWIKNFTLYRKNVLLSSSTTWKQSVNRTIELLDLIEAKNTQLKPFKMVITYDDADYSDDVFELPVKQ